MRKWIVTLGTFASILVLLVVVPIVFGIVARALDKAFGFHSLPIDRNVELILTGMIWSFGLFWVFWAHSYLIFVGYGTPVEAFGIALIPTKVLVTAGPYAYVRNPALFGMLLFLLGVAFLISSVSALILIPIIAGVLVLHLRLFEERNLLKRFGEPYEHYRSNVPLLIPNPVPYIMPD